MKRASLVALAVLFISASAFAGTVVEEGTQDTMRINVGLKSSGYSSAVVELLSDYDGVLVQEIPQINVLTFEVPASLFDSIVFDAGLNAVTAYVEEDFVRSIPPIDAVEVFGTDESGSGLALYPNDPSYPSQWGPPCIDAESAWDMVLGDSNVIVAISDTGIDLDHPDLAANVDTSLDYDFVHGDDVADDDHGHGSHVAGIVAAEINNMVGIAGLQQVTLMAVKSLNRLGFGRDSWLAPGIIYAADNGAKVINCSWGGTGYSTTIKNAVDYAFDQGALVVAAAGNSGSSQSHYPAAYNKALGVAALETCTTRASYSNFGNQNVLIAAPGSDIYSTYKNGGYATFDGTSMAAPHVTGVVAAYYSYNPSLTLEQVVRHMLTNADDLGTPGRDQYFGYGRVDMYPFAD
jgi:subtilisin family serine protease